MPVDSRHGRYVPDGKPLLRVLRPVLAAQAHEAARAAARGWATDLARWDAILADLAEPVLARYAEAGYAATARRFAAARVPTAKALAGMAKGAPPRRRLSAGFFPTRAEVLAAVRDLARTFARAVGRTLAALVRRELTAGLAAADPPAALAARVGRAVRDPARAARIAATEASRAAHLGQYHAGLDLMRTSGLVLKKRWLASADACDLCHTLDGLTFNWGERFYVDPRGGPYADVLFPPAHPNCRCAMAEEVV